MYIRPHQLSITCLVILVLAYAFHLVVTDAKLKIVVEGGAFHFAPATVRLRIRVEPDVKNRALAVGIISPDFETSSLEQLDGDKAPITRWVTYKDVPAGEYAVVAEVYRPEDRPWREETSVSVRGYD